jgi:hypothetical protein
MAQLQKEQPIDTTNKGDSDFVAEMKDKFIPAIKRMIEKESEHLEWLVKRKNIPEAKFFADDSFYRIEQYKQSLIEYENYVEKNEKP